MSTTRQPAAGAGRTPPFLAAAGPARGSRGGLSPAGNRRRAVVVLALLVVAVAVVALRGGPQDPARALGQRFADAWARADYAEMYADLSPATRARMAPSDLAGAYRSADATATTVRRRAGRARAGAGRVVTVPVTVTTRLFGVITGEFALPLVPSSSGPRVGWTDELVFPGLRAGEHLSRRTRLGPRGPLLARDGARIAYGQAPTGGQRLSSLGAAATAIAGVLGPVPPDRAAELRADGYPDRAQVGIDGLERAFEQRLAGTPGGELLAGSRRIASSQPRPGAAVRTTIAPHLQAQAVAALGGRDGAVIAMRPDGELLALAGIPLSGLQPPGSTFKMVTVTSVLENRLARPSTTFPIETQALLSGTPLQNANGESCGGTLLNAFAMSCNSVFAPLGAKLGAKRLVATAREYGFNEPAGIPGAKESTIPASSITDDLAAGSAAIGQGEVQATALQMAIVAATIANGGLRPHPTLAAGAIRPAVRAVPAAVARSVGRMMRAVVRFGTGTKAAIPGVVVAGKTGTAELRQTAGCTAGDQTTTPNDPCGTPGDPRNTDAWFASFAPASAPRIVVAVLLVSNGAGGDTAAPVARQVLQAGLARR